jgi:hypothetical protein
MVNATNLYKSDYITLDLIRNLNSRKATILNEGKIEEFEKNKKLVIEVEISGEIYKYALNKTSYENLSKEWGEESKKWVGNVVLFNIMKVRGNEGVIAIPFPNDLNNLKKHYPDDVEVVNI